MIAEKENLVNICNEVDMRTYPDMRMSVLLPSVPSPSLQLRAVPGSRLGGRPKSSVRSVKHWSKDLFPRTIGSAHRTLGLYNPTFTPRSVAKQPETLNKATRAHRTNSQQKFFFIPNHGFCLPPRSSGPSQRLVERIHLSTVLH